ncbi:T9SS type A sorting domain-containing protein [bacterium]|nr:T9SS type A sorting domain-containing protein [bacterium]
MKKNAHIFLVLLILLITIDFSNSTPFKDKETMFTNPTESCIEPLTLYDINEYIFHIEFLIPSTVITNELGINLTTLASVDTIKLDFAGDSMFVDSVVCAMGELPFSRVGDVLKIHLLETALPGDHIYLGIYYHGTPSDGYAYRTNRHGNPVYSTLFWASTARYFYPCVDHPKDKAACDIQAVVPSEFTIASNGVLISDLLLPEEDKRIMHWHSDFPICTYNICFSICDYSVVIDSLDTLPIYYYVYPESEANALYDLGRTPEVIDFYSSLFGSYPFRKYGINLAPSVGGGMEHQTMVSLDQLLINGRRTYEWLFMHELCHQWFGDAVGLGDWRDFWLSEGFAVYSEALMTGYFEGPEAEKTYVQSLQGEYTSHEGSEGRFPIYDPEVYLGYTIYSKAPCVLHNLRFVMGDSLFFSAVREYFSRFKYSIVTTPDLQGVCEEYYGSSLSWFFDEWIYDRGYPEFTYSQRCYPSPIPEEQLLKIIITQVQYDAPLFTFPLEIRVSLTSYDFYDTLFIDDSVDTFVIPIPADEEVEIIRIDPNGYMIESSREVSGISEESVLKPEMKLVIYPNPTNTNANINFTNILSGFYQIKIYNLFGEEVNTVFEGYLPSNEHKFTWQGETNLAGDAYPKSLSPSGIYYCVVKNAGNVIEKERIILIK